MKVTAYLPSERAFMQVSYQSRRSYEHLAEAPVNTWAVVMLDPGARPMRWPPGSDHTLEMAFHDITERCDGLVVPSYEQVIQIAAFIQQCHKAHGNVMALCEAGVGRSAAVAAGASQMLGIEYATVRDSILRRGAYNRRIYHLLLTAAELPTPPEPKVSIVVRVKYPLDALMGFIFSMQRQRYDNWELVVVTDGPNAEALELIRQLGDARIVPVETPERRGRWGHPWRQLGIDKATGDIIGLQNDDNYLTPGFIEQSVLAMQAERADMVMINHLHNYYGYRPLESRVGESDLGAWMAKAELVKATPWTGDDFLSDNDYIKAVAAKAQTIVNPGTVLFVHN